MVKISSTNFVFTPWLLQSFTKPKLWLASVLQRPNCDLGIEAVEKEKVQIGPRCCFLQIKKGKTERGRDRITIKTTNKKIVIHHIATQSSLWVELRRSPKTVLSCFVILFWHLIFKSETLPHSWHNCSWRSKSSNWSWRITKYYTISSEFQHWKVDWKSDLAEAIQNSCQSALIPTKKAGTELQWSLLSSSESTAQKAD